MSSREAGREMHAAIHDLLAERASLRQHVTDLDLELEVARQMLRQQPLTPPLGRTA